MRKHLHGTGVQYDGKVAEGAIERNVGNIRQQDGSRPVRLKFSVYQVF